MKTIRRDSCGSSDLARMAALAREFPGDNLHVVDLPYRFSSWALDDPDNAALWVDVQERLLGWAVMQAPFWSIDYVLHPAAGPALHRDVLAWADGRARELAGTTHERPAWFVHVLAPNTAARQALEEAGFVDQANVEQDSWSKVLMLRGFAEPVLAWGGPTGYCIRPLAGEGEVEAYVALHRAVFGSPNMTRGWRVRTLCQPEYREDLDLVAVAPDGTLAAICVAWLDSSSRRAPTGQIEPLGVHEAHRHIGLGRAILAESLCRLHHAGAHSVCVETDNYRGAALTMYESVGFQRLHDVRVYRKDYA